MTPKPTTVPSDAERVALWLLTADGVAMVAREMRRCGCPASFDSDLARMTMNSAQRMVDSGQAIESVPAWATLAFRRRAMDLMKAPAYRWREPLDEDDVAVTHAGVNGDQMAEVLARLELADIRRQVGHADGHRHPWPLSASLSFLSIAVEGCVPGRQCPAPIGGADEYDAAHWAALFYAGSSECFAPRGEADNATIRQRRKRRIDAVRAVLADAYAATQGEDDDG
jgi:hypothetical protein